MTFRFDYTTPDGGTKHFITCADSLRQAENKARFLIAVKLGIKQDDVEMTCKEKDVWRMIEQD